MFGDTMEDEELQADMVRRSTLDERGSGDSLRNLVDVGVRLHTL